MSRRNQNGFTQADLPYPALAEVSGDDAGRAIGHLATTIRELQDAATPPPVRLRSWRSEPINPDLAEIHINGEDLGEDLGKAVLIKDTGENVRADVIKWENQKIILRGEPGATYVEVVITKKDGTIAASVGLPVLPPGLAKKLDVSWALTHTFVDSEGIHFIGTGMTQVGSVKLLDDTYPATEFVGQVLRTTDTEVLVAFPAEATTPLERGILTNHRGTASQEVGAVSWDLAFQPWTRAGEVEWWGAWTANGAPVLNISGTGFGESVGTVLVTVDNVTVPMTVVEWTDTHIQVEAEPGTVYSNLVVKTAADVVVASGAYLAPSVETAPAPAVWVSASSPSNRTIKLVASSGAADVARITVGFTAGSIDLYHPELFPGAAGYNAGNGVTILEWSDTEVRFTSPYLAYNGLRTRALGLMAYNNNYTVNSEFDFPDFDVNVTVPLSFTVEYDATADRLAVTATQPVFTNQVDAISYETAEAGAGYGLGHGSFVVESGTRIVVSGADSKIVGTTLVKMTFYGNAGYVGEWTGSLSTQSIAPPPAPSHPVITAVSAVNTDTLEILGTNLDKAGAFEVRCAPGEPFYAFNLREPASLIWTATKVWVSNPNLPGITLTQAKPNDANDNAIPGTVWFDINPDLTMPTMGG